MKTMEVTINQQVQLHNSWNVEHIHIDIYNSSCINII